MGSERCNPAQRTRGTHTTAIPRNGFGLVIMDRGSRFACWNDGGVILEGTTSPSRDMICPGFCVVLALGKPGGRRECRMLAAPASLACKRNALSRTQETTGQPDNRHSLRNGLRLIRGLLGAPGFLATVARLFVTGGLDPSVGGSGLHDFAVRVRHFVDMPFASIASPPHGS